MMQQRLRATCIGFTATLMWATLPVVAVATRSIPSYQVTSSAFFIAFLLSVLNWRYKGQPVLRMLRMPMKFWLLGIFGLFGFHVFYFIALRSAPPVESLLLINVWPLLMVALAARLEKQRLRPWHVIGMLAGFSGIAVLGTREGFSFSSEYALGYVSAAACAVIWTFYSVLSRRLAGQIPPQAIGCYCLAAAVLLGLLHLVFEETVPLNNFQMLAVAYIGIMPMGLAFYSWDHGVKHGDVRVLGALSYLGPMIGSVLLVAFGYAELTTALILAAALILGGAFISSVGTFFSK